MRKLIVFLSILTIVGFVFAQSTSQIGDIKGRRFNAPAIRTAFEAIATGTKTVSGVWTVSGDWVVTGAWDFSNIQMFDSLATDSINVAGNAVLDSILVGTGTSLIHSPHADTLSVDETVVNVSGTLSLGSDPSTTLTETTFTLANGATITNPHADTLSIDETVLNFGGAVTIGTNPTMSITAIDTFGAARYAILTIAGEDFILWKKADSSAIID